MPLKKTIAQEMYTSDDQYEMTVTGRSVRQSPLVSTWVPMMCRPRWITVKREGMTEAIAVMSDRRRCPAYRDVCFFQHINGHIHVFTTRTHPTLWRTAI
jgi:hypothetical protein